MYGTKWKIIGTNICHTHFFYNMACLWHGAAVASSSSQWFAPLFAGAERESWAASGRLNLTIAMLVKQRCQSMTSKLLLKGIKLSLKQLNVKRLMALFYSAFGVYQTFFVTYFILQKPRTPKIQRPHYKAICSMSLFRFNSYSTR